MVGGFSRAAVLKKNELYILFGMQPGKGEYPSRGGSMKKGRMGGGGGGSQ